MCIGVRALQASPGRERPLDGDEVADHLDGLGPSPRGFYPPGVRALTLHLSMRHGLGMHPADRAAYQFRHRQTRRSTPWRATRHAARICAPNPGSGGGVGAGQVACGGARAGTPWLFGSACRIRPCAASQDEVYAGRFPGSAHATGAGPRFGYLRIPDCTSVLPPVR